MKKSFSRDQYDLYELTPKREQELWDNAVFVFDTSALLDLYYLSSTERGKFYSNILGRLRDRLWIPAHAEYEFLKNREKVMRRVFADKYDAVNKKVKDIHSAFIKSIKNNIENLADDTKKDDKHPYLDQQPIDNLKAEISNFQVSLEEFSHSISTQIQSAREDIIKSEIEDDLLKALEEHFETGPAFSFNECIEIVKEGNIRFERKIPPGYGDYYKNDKKGIQIFADLIIWKETLRYSRKASKNIIFITNDLAKDDDWCHVKDESGDYRVISPRAELIKEMNDNSGSDFWMYSLSQFIYHSNTFISSEFEPHELKEIDDSLSNRRQKLGFFVPEDLYEREFCVCVACEGGRDGEGNLVSLDYEIDISNNYPSKHAFRKFETANGGTCGYCNTFNLRCPKCNSPNAFHEDEYNKSQECEGGCGLIFYMDASYEDDLVSETNLILLDHRIVSCNACGEDFIRTAREETCPKCEESYNND